MKLTYNWLKEFVDITISPQALADKLTMAGLEVTSLEARDGDTVIEIEITSNRPDWLSVVGIAREVAAITGKKLKLSQDTRHKTQEKKKPADSGVNRFDITIEDKKDCPLYTARIISGVKVEPSPEWLRSRLELIGCRSVNNIVDITNYILFTWGEPLHAFDLDTLNRESIVVRRAKMGEKMLMINGQEKQLDPGILVIADRQKPVAAAGVMGSKETEVSEKTKNILLEAAVFDPVVVRRGRQALGLQSESAYRFERGVDRENADLSSQKAVALIGELAGGECVLAKHAGALKTPEKQVALELETLNRLLGVVIEPAKIKRILISLGFKVSAKSKGVLTAGVPSFRQDVSVDRDLVEEAARIFGYENIPTSLPAFIAQAQYTNSLDNTDFIKDCLTSLGLFEAVTYSLVDEAFLRKSGISPIEPVALQNPLSEEQGVLRTTLIPSLLRCVAGNLNQNQGLVNIFEVAHVFSREGAQVIEKPVVSFVLCGTRNFWLAQGRVKDEMGVLHGKGIIETIFAHAGIREYGFQATEGGSTIDVVIGKEPVGKIYILRKSACEQFQIKNREVFAAELSLDKIFAAADFKKKFKPLPMYPAISRDLSFVIKADVPVAEILSAIKEKAGPFLRDASIVDCYQGKQIPAGFKGLTISCLYRWDEGTLTETQIAPLHTAASEVLRERFSAVLR
ncbi:MAG: phenylalanine--tRNA ligase subunit beta [Candidatus Omnitrophota bacterium]|jgi:phenylalanyl-tRNA synthetase beta chain